MLIEINDIGAPELDVFARLTEAQLRSRLEPEKGVFIAESRRSSRPPWKTAISRFRC